ncbi:hypothetical protein [Barrientosiimonas endolithica]|uniref:hypothetical protein n=1 Tax=Barrientosiimonas endolithica TaxID=1535208 RepID=UPI00259BDE5E|nr:hypothetical protein [Barrientosiimonas endolithica]
MAVLSAATTRQTVRQLSAREATGVLLSRNVLVYRRGWLWFVTGFLEPVLFLLSSASASASSSPASRSTATRCPTPSSSRPRCSRRRR